MLILQLKLFPNKFCIWSPSMRPGTRLCLGNFIQKNRPRGWLPLLSNIRILFSLNIITDRGIMYYIDPVPTASNGHE